MLGRIGHMSTDLDQAYLLSLAANDGLQRHQRMQCSSAATRTSAGCDSGTKPNHLGVVIRWTGSRCLRCSNFPLWPCAPATTVECILDQRRLHSAF